MDVPLINDLNYAQFTGNGQFVNVNGSLHPLSLQGDLGNARTGGLSSSMREMDFTLIERGAWPDLIAKKDAEKSWPEDILRDSELGIPTIDQDGLNYCWIYCDCQELMIARCLAGLEHIALAPESVGGPMTNFRNVGGYPEEGMEYAEKHGFCPMIMLNGTEHQLSPRKWTPGWEQEALKHRPAGHIDLSKCSKVFDALVTNTFIGRCAAVGYGWWRHAVVAGLRVLNLGKNSRGQYRFAVRNWNNWGDKYGERGMVDIEEGKGTPDLGCTTVVLV